MAVYTPFDRPDFEQACEAFAVGAFREAHGIPQGSINTNYRLETATGRYFLRHSHLRSAADLTFEAELLDLLHQSAYPAPSILRTTSGQPFLELKGGRAMVFRWLAGEEKTRSRLTWEVLVNLGREVGKLHRITNSFVGERENPYSPEVVRGWLAELLKHPDGALVATAQELVDALPTSETFGDLVPRAVIHADLFLDNVKWVGDRVSAIFDFEMACREALVLDVAITLNAWCFDGGAYRPELCRGFLSGYEDERTLTPGEPSALYRAALFGAIRFTTSRIRDFHLSELPADRLSQKDYRTYLARVRALKTLGEEGFLRLIGR